MTLTKAISKLCLPLTVLVAATVAVPALAQKHDPANDRSRLLLIFAPTEDSKPLNAEYEALQKDTGEVNSEDVDIVYVIGDNTVKLPPPDSRTETAENMRKRYHVDATGFRIVLVGRDGWEKKRWSEPTDPHAILSRAADMPRPKSALDPEH